MVDANNKSPSGEAPTPEEMRSLLNKLTLEQKLEVCKEVIATSPRPVVPDQTNDKPPARREGLICSSNAVFTVDAESSWQDLANDAGVFLDNLQELLRFLACAVAEENAHEGEIFMTAGTLESLLFNLLRSAELCRGVTDEGFARARDEIAWLKRAAESAEQHHAA